MIKKEDLFEGYRGISENLKGMTDDLFRGLSDDKIGVINYKNIYPDYPAFILLSCSKIVCDI